MLHPGLWSGLWGLLQSASASNESEKEGDLKRHHRVGFSFSAFVKK